MSTRGITSINGSIFAEEPSYYETCPDCAGHGCVWCGDRGEVSYTRR
jgi:hypothetical protein